MVCEACGGCGYTGPLVDRAMQAAEDQEDEFNVGFVWLFMDLMEQLGNEVDAEPCKECSR